MFFFCYPHRLPIPTPIQRRRPRKKNFFHLHRMVLMRQLKLILLSWCRKLLHLLLPLMLQTLLQLRLLRPCLLMMTASCSRHPPVEWKVESRICLLPHHLSLTIEGFFYLCFGVWRRVLTGTSVPWCYKSSYAVCFLSLWKRSVSHDTACNGFLERSSGSPSIGVQILSWRYPLCLWWTTNPRGFGLGRRKPPNCYM